MFLIYYENTLHTDCLAVAGYFQDKTVHQAAISHTASKCSSSSGISPMLACSGSPCLNKMFFILFYTSIQNHYYSLSISLIINKKKKNIEKKSFCFTGNDDSGSYVKALKKHALRGKNVQHNDYNLF